MGQVYNPETDLIEEIERLEIEARDLRRKLKRIQNPQDQRVLNKQLGELEQQIKHLQARVP